MDVLVEELVAGHAMRAGGSQNRFAIEQLDTGTGLGRDGTDGGIDSLVGPESERVQLARPLEPRSRRAEPLQRPERSRDPEMESGRHAVDRGRGQEALDRRFMASVAGQGIARGDGGVPPHAVPRAEALAVHRSERRAVPEIHADGAHDYAGTGPPCGRHHVPQVVPEILVYPREPGRVRRHETLGEHRHAGPASLFLAPDGPARRRDQLRQAKRIQANGRTNERQAQASPGQRRPGSVGAHYFIVAGVEDEEVGAPAADVAGYRQEGVRVDRGDAGVDDLEADGRVSVAEHDLQVSRERVGGLRVSFRGRLADHEDAEGAGSLLRRNGEGGRQTERTGGKELPGEAVVVAPGCPAPNRARHRERRRMPVAGEPKEAFHHREQKHGARDRDEGGQQG